MTGPPPWGPPAAQWLPAAPRYKGWALGLPPTGPWSLAEPGKRLAARVLDGLFFAPVWLAIVAAVVLVTAPHYGPLFPTDNGCVDLQPSGRICPSSGPPGFVWLELSVIGAGLAASALYVVLDAAITARWGRTPGKAVMRIRPLHRVDRSPLTFWRALGRAAAVAFAGSLSWIGLADYLWCVWDENVQCVHDKVADTIVVNDR